MKLRLAIWLFLLLGWLSLLWLAIRPFGVATYSLEQRQGNYFIHKVAPSERWATSSKALVMIGQPGYFFLRPTRPFRQAEVTVTWQPRATDTYLSAGLLMDRRNWQYQTKPLNNPALNQLTWPSITSGSQRLWQKQPSYDSWDDFLAQPPAVNRLAVDNWSPSSSTSQPPVNYQLGTDWQKIPGQWRGLQQLIMYLAPNELLAWRLAISSDSLKTLTPSEQQIEVNITNSSNKRVWSGRRQLDGSRLDWELLVGPWPAGAYRLEIKASPQLLIKLSTKQTVFGWQGQIWPVASTSEHWQFWTDVPQVTVQTIQPLSRQVVKIGQQAIDVAKTYQQYQLATNQAVTKIEFKGGDLQLAGNGIFSLSTAVFNPQPRRVDRFLVDRLDSLDFIVADYQEPSCDQKLCRATAVLSLIGADWQAGDGYKIMLAANDSQLSIDDPLVIKRIDVRLTGLTLGQFVRSLPQRLLVKIRQVL